MKRNIITCLVLLLSISLSANKGKADNWIDDILKSKAEIQGRLSMVDMPLISTWVKATQPAEALSANVTGQDRLILITDGGPDGSYEDWATWGNAHLIKKDGTIVWLDSLEPVYVQTGFGGAVKNTKMDGSPMSIGGKKYEHSVLCHSDGMLIYQLDKQYVRFEAEVGIADGSRNGSTYFKVMNIVPKEEISNLYAWYPQKIGSFFANMERPEEWIFSKDAAIEKEILTKITSKLKDDSYFRKEINRISSQVAGNKSAAEYLRLYEKAQHILSLQEELEWLNLEAIQLAFNDMMTINGFESIKYQPVINELSMLCKKGFNDIYSGNNEAIQNAEKALENKQLILMANPLLNTDKIVAARYKMGNNARTGMAMHLGTQENNWSNQQSTPRTGYDAEIIELSNLRDDIQIRSIYKSESTAPIADLKLHWDGDKVMFTTTMPDKRWNVFEIKLDGTGYRPLVHTEEPELEFYDGTYLPDGRIIANANIGYQGVPCVNGIDPVGNMILYTPETKNIRRLTFDQDANWNPVIMNNGRVMYTRWEYTDLTHYFSRIVMHMNPDGTENKALFGSGSLFPNSTFDLQPLPGYSSAFVGIISGHHGITRSGRIILFDPLKARKGVEGMIQEIPYRNREIIPEVKDELVNGVWPQFIKPTPLNDKYFLVAAKLTPEDLWGIYLVDVFDNVTCIMKTEGEGFINPILVRKTETPPAIPDRVNLNDKESTVFIQDIYEGEGLRGVPRGTVKSLRIHSYEYAYLHTPSDHTAQGIQSGWDIKRLLGTVPVEEDGSVIFKVPANTPIAIQPLDKDGAAIQWMRSWFTGMPGEVVSCVGCHEDQNLIPIPKRVAASMKAPTPLTLPEGGTRSFTFDLEMQPILDRACISCHNGNGKAFDLRGGTKDKKGYGTSYLNLHPYVHRQGPEADIVVLQPYEYHASTSELVRILKTGHYGVELTDEEWKTIYNWIDYNAPDKGYFEAYPFAGFPYQGYDQYQRRIELNNKYANGAGVDWRKELTDYADYLKNKDEGETGKPTKKDSHNKAKKLSLKNWPLNKEDINKMLSQEKETRKELVVAPGVKINFVRIPAGQFIMGSENGAADNQPVFIGKVDKAFWMGEIEITNQQYTALVPEHDSRYVDQFWKDHTHPGYPANLPEQPVIRVSYEDAIQYCQKLSEMTGLKFNLPSETQWEWACRAGTDSDFWYGGMNTDFSKFENLADAQLLKMAVIGIDPQPMSPDDQWYPYYTYLPKEESVDDGNMLQVNSDAYQSNPFGLYSMHGNIAEWTRSDYVPYPLTAKNQISSEYKVVRGGSYIDRPKFSASYSRKGYYPWQRIHNVGFRVIIEE